jgi:hypothetical protein
MMGKDCDVLAFGPFSILGGIASTAISSTLELGGPTMTARIGFMKALNCDQFGEFRSALVDKSVTGASVNSRGRGSQA